MAATLETDWAGQTDLLDLAQAGDYPELFPGTCPASGARGETGQCAGCPRLRRLLGQTNAVIDDAVKAADGYKLTGIVGTFSGGDDSTVLGHIIKDRVTHFAHANTQVGAEPTRQFVRDTAARWQVPLIEMLPPSFTYENLVLRSCPSTSPRAKYPFVYAGGFPGGQDHRQIFGYLKDKALRKIVATLNPEPRSQRAVFINGRRRDESQARSRRVKGGTLSPVAREGSAIICTPMLGWSKLDLNLYRRHYALPVNETAKLLHMSMECACGCWAREGEIGEIETWLPGLAEYLHRLEWRLRKIGLDIDPKRLTWGWHNGGRCITGTCNT
jgi:3'-phosphoadenosine 5'-phosphosulfate sulfotransferase (PAPS reductase)/FAD synthetase